MFSVYTYYDLIGSKSYHDDQLEMIEHWSLSWAKQGWNPVVLGRIHAEAHPMFSRYEARVRQLPTVNSTEYEAACYLRWLAVAQQGGGVMSDYDVVNYGFSPCPPQSELVVMDCRDGDVCPSVVAGTAAGFMSACLSFACTEADSVDTSHSGSPHTSDMILLQRDYREGRVLASPLVRQYGDHGWDTATLVHYSHEATGHTNRIPCMKTAREI